jgi:hypothetical protein
LHDDGENVALHYLMDMRQANDQKFLNKIAQLKLEGHPINWADLHRELKEGSFGQTMDLHPYGFCRPKTELPYIRNVSTSMENETMTSADNIRMAGRLSALENLLALAVFDRARLDRDPLAWMMRYVANLRRGTPLTCQKPLPDEEAMRLAEETHRAILEFADMLEAQLQELVRTGQITKSQI